MKDRSFKKTLVISALALVVTINSAQAAAPEGPGPEPDAGLLAAVDIQAAGLVEGTAVGDFESWYPGIYPGFGWTRTTTDAGSNGFFRVDYAVFDLHGHHPHRQTDPIDELSILLFRPQPPQGEGLRGRLPPSALPDRRGAGGGHRPAELTPAEQAVRTIEDALVAAQSFATNARYYFFLGDSRSLSLVSHLPDSFPGAESYGGAAVRRVSFRLQPNRQRRPELVMEHAPLLVDLRPRQVEPFRVTLAEDVSVLHLQYWDALAADWVEQWTSTNALPKMVQVTLGLGQPQGRDRLPRDLSSRIVALPGATVMADIQGPELTNLPLFLPPTNRPPLPVFPPLAPRPRANGEPDGLLPAWQRDHFGPERQRDTRHVSSREVELEWLGRSGVELARYVLANDGTGPLGQIDSKMNKWAGGPGDPNGALASLDLNDYAVGAGTLSVKIEDQESKFNINAADAGILQNALTLIGVDAAQIPTITDSILDWRDPDETPRPHGAESASYLSLHPPYFAKNGPLDDLSELLLVRGVTPAMYAGASTRGPGSTFAIGLADLFTPLSGRLININTASRLVLQIFPEIDDFSASAIIAARAGPDGIEGTVDDTPFRSPAELARVPGLSPSAVSAVRRYLTVHSLIFEVQVDVQIAHEHRQFVALLRRNNPADVQLLNLSWR